MRPVIRPGLLLIVWELLRASYEGLKGLDEDSAVHGAGYKDLCVASRDLCGVSQELCGNSKGFHGDCRLFGSRWERIREVWWCLEDLIPLG